MMSRSWTVLIMLTVRRIPLGLEKLYARAILTYLLIMGLNVGQLYQKHYWVFLAFVLASERMSWFFDEAPQGLPAYQPDPPFLPEVDAVSGPFGIRLSAVELGAADDSLELTITGTHRGIPNLGDAERRVTLYVDSVSDAAGNELLREESCGRERNDLAVELDRPHFNNSLTGDKTVRLKPGVRHADIHRIRGRVELALPAEVETIRLAALDTEQTIDREGIRVALKASDADTLDFKVYGDHARLYPVWRLSASTTMS